MRYPIFDLSALHDLLIGVTIGLILTFLIRGFLGV